MRRQTVVRGAVGIALQAILAAALAAGPAVTPALAAGPLTSGRGSSGHVGGGGGGKGGGGGGGGGSTTSTGNDVSYPQCGTTLPSGQAFGIVGVNHGLPNSYNTCLGTELAWAESSTGTAKSTVTGTLQPKASLYVNTADPGSVYNGATVADWPTSGTDSYGTCGGGNSDACAWLYGYEKAIQDVGFLTGTAASATAASFPWWLDVETANTWQSDTTMNVADLQGMVYGLEQSGATSVGIYSTGAQWGTIAGATTTSTGGSLYKLPEWLPGARKLSDAEANCAQTSFTGGTIEVTQWFGHPVDGDYAC